MLNGHNGASQLQSYWFTDIYQMVVFTSRCRSRHYCNGVAFLIASGASRLHRILNRRLFSSVDLPSVVLDGQSLSAYYSARRQPLLEWYAKW